MNEEKKSIFEEKTIVAKGQTFNNYSVTPYGAVINKVTRKVLKSREMKNSHGPHLQGYQVVDIYTDDGKKRTMLKHRVVAENYIPNPENLPTVNHKDGDKSKNNYSNLEWMSFKDNNMHALDTGLSQRAKCENHRNATLTNKDVENICELLEKGYLYEDIARILHLENIVNIESKIKMIKTGNAWKEISCKYNLPTEPNRTYVNNPQIVHKICEYLEKYGFTSNDEILDYLGIEKNEKTRKLVYSVRTRRKFKNISAQYKF